MEEQLWKNNINDEEEIDLRELAHVLLNKLWAILLCMVVCAVAAFGGTKAMITPQYTATSVIYILSTSTSITSLTDLQVGSSLTADFIALSKSRPVVERVIEQLDLDTTYSELVNRVSISNPTDTHLLQISATNPDPELAAEIANAMTEAVKEQISEVMNTDKPNTVEKAIVPKLPSSPNVPKNTMMGGLLGAVAVAAVIILLYLLDDTIKNEEDVRKYLQVNTLAAIPWEKKRKAGKRKKAA